MADVTFWAAVWIVGSGLGCAAVAALNEWVVRRHPDRFTARTGLDPRTREVVGPPALDRSRTVELVEHRRRAGVEPWRSR